MWAVIPVRRLDAAKSRLAPILSPPQRRRLALAMAEDTARTLCRARGLTSVALVSDDPAAEDLAGRLGVAHLRDAGSEGQSAAAERASVALARAGAAAVLTISADLPLLTVADVERLLGVAREVGRGVVLVPDRHGSGTNAMICAPPGAIRFAFGPGSLARHAGAARAAGLAQVIHQSAGLGLDIDLPADLRDLAQAGRPPGSAVRAVLEAFRHSETLEHFERGLA